MKSEDVQKLSHGLYRVFWKTGGSSLAAVGSNAAGKRWLAPTNWVSISQDFNKTWLHVERVEFLRYDEKGT